MSSSYSTFELQYNLDIQCVQKILTLIMPMSKYLVSTMKEVQVIHFFSIIEGKLQKDEINAIQTYNCPNLQV